MTTRIMDLPPEQDQEENLLLPKKVWWKRPRYLVLISALLLILIILGLVLPGILRPRTITYQSQKVTQSNFDLTVSATGPIMTGTYNVVFSGSGKLTEIDAKVGQSVKKGDVLAKLDKTSLQDALDEAQASALSSQSSLDTAQNNYNKTLAQSQASVDAAQTTFNNAQATLTKTQAQGQSSISASLQAIADDQTALTNTQQASQASIDAAQTTLNNDQTALNNTQKQDQASINAAQKSLSNAQTSLSKTQTQAQAQIQVAADQETQSKNTCAAGAAANLTSCDQTATDTYNQAVAQAQTSITTAQNAVNTAQQSLKTTQAQANSDNSTAQARVSSDQKALQTAQAQAQSNNSSAQSKINTDQSSLNTARSNSAANLTTAQNSVSTAQSSLKSAQAQAAATDASSQGQVVSAQSQFNSVQTQLDTAKHNLDNATLTAPHSGIVTTVNGTIGGTPGVPVNSTSTTASGSTFIQLIDTSALQVQANVNESDAGNLQIGLPVQFTVSAFGDKTFHGAVSAISPNGQSASNVVTYPVTVDVNMTSLRGASLLPNMTANITITVVHHANTILIPVTAINFARNAIKANTAIGQKQALITKSVANTALDQARQMVLELKNAHPDGSMDTVTPAYVVEQEGSQYIVKPVVLGLTDETVYEVIQGLSSGESVLVGSQS